MPASKLKSRQGVAVSHMYIPMRPDWPPGGVAKFALLMPEPSWALRITKSLPTPPALLLLNSKFPARFFEAEDMEKVVVDVYRVEELGDIGVG